MIRSFPSILLALLFAVMLLASGCKESEEEAESKKWAVTLSKTDKKPYGAYLAYESMKYYFTGSDIQDISSGFRYTNIDWKLVRNPAGKSLLVLSGLDFYVSEQEWDKLKNFVYWGNELVVFCSDLDPKIEQELHYTKNSGGEEDPITFRKDIPVFFSEHVLRLNNNSDVRYGYKGRTLLGHFRQIKNTDTDTIPNKNDTSSWTHEYLGFVELPNRSKKDTLPRPNIIRFAYGSGHLTLHAAPLVLSNYFLLQPNNINYLTQICQSLPDSIATVCWQDYYKRSAEESDWDILMRYRETRFALWLAVIVAVCYILFQGKRRQRIIPIIAPLRNESVAFVTTIGRLYFNKGNHANLAGKLIQQFLEWVRVTYYIGTGVLNEGFAYQLSMKSGIAPEVVAELMEMITEIRTNSVQPDDAFIFRLYNIIQQFYKTTR
jgi:hypothetical protein